MGKLSTHVLDLVSGRGADGMKVELFRDGRAEPMGTYRTGADGRVAGGLVPEGALETGRYRLVFHVERYYSAGGNSDAGRFLTEVPIVFTVDDGTADYHVPLLVSPWSYSTYRGS